MFRGSLKHGNIRVGTKGARDVDPWPEVGGGLRQGLKKFTICTSKTYFWGPVQLWTTKAHKLVILVGSRWICEIFSESCSDFQKTSKTPPPKFFPQVVSNGQIFGVNTYWQKWVWAMKMSWGESRTTVKCVSATYNHCGLSEVHSLLSTSLFPCQWHGWEFMGCINAQAIFGLWWLQNLLSQCSECCGLWPIMETNEWYNWAPFWKKKVSSVKVKHFFEPTARWIYLKWAAQGPFFKRKRLHIFSDFSYSFSGIWSKFQGQFPKMEHFSRTTWWNFSKLGQELQLTNSHCSRYSKRKSIMVEYFGGLCLSMTVAMPDTSAAPPIGFDA